MVRRTRLSWGRDSHRQWRRESATPLQWITTGLLGSLLLCALSAPIRMRGQSASSPPPTPSRTPAPEALLGTPSQISRPAYRMRSSRFLAGRSAPHLNAAAALDQARRQHLALLAEPRTAALGAPWQAVGPGRIASLSYGTVTGRITSIAVDPEDSTGNTVYIGTTGGGVWKSTNAAGPAAGVSFTPLTDTLPVFSASAGTAVIPSLSIGAISVGQ